LNRKIQKSAADFGRRLDVPGGRRTEQRNTVRLSVSLHAINCSRPVVLLDVSRTGAKMHMPEAMYCGQEVWLKLPQWQLFGIVRWVSGKQCGISFDEPLNKRQLSDLRRHTQLLAAHGLSKDAQLCVDDWRGNLAR
jgi:hypothetical protein